MVPAWSDERIDRIIGNLLRAGVLSATAVVLLGGIVFLTRHGAETPNYHDFQGEISELRVLKGIVVLAWDRSGQGIIQLGILLLIGTPIARVAFSVFAFAVQRDPTYVIVTLIVLAVLLYSIFVG